MKQFARIMLTVLGLAVVAAALSSIPTKPVGAAPAGPSVTVANTPLPVQGTVGVNNFPSTQAVSGTVVVSNFPSTQQVSGTVNANVTFPSSLAVGNATNNGIALPLVTVPGVPLGTGDANTCTFSGANTCSATVIVAPSNDAFVPQSLSGFCNLLSGGNQITHIYVNLDSAPRSLIVPGPLIPEGGFSTQNFQQNVTGLYIEPNGSLGLQVYAQNADTGDCSFYVVGYLVAQ